MDHATSVTARDVNFFTSGLKLCGELGLGVNYRELGIELAQRLADHSRVFQAEVKGWVGMSPVSYWTFRP